MHTVSSVLRQCGADAPQRNCVAIAIRANASVAMKGLLFFFFYRPLSSFPTQDPLVAQAGPGTSALKVSCLRKRSRRALCRNCRFPSAKKPHGHSACKRFRAMIMTEPPNRRLGHCGFRRSAHRPPLTKRQEYILFEGTILLALLITWLPNGSACQLTCLLSNNIYSRDRQHLLVSAGSKI